MRDELRKLEGSLVMVTGRVLEKHPVPGEPEVINILVSPAVVQPWDGMSALIPGQGAGLIHLDHLWFRMHATAVQTEMLQKCMIVGTVHYYQRAKDGSVDLGVDSQPSCDLDALVERSIKDLKESKEGTLQKMRDRREKLLEALSYVLNQGDGGYAFSRFYNLEEAAVELARRFSHLDKSIEATESRLKTATANGHCKGLRTVGRIQGAKRPRVKGFVA